MKIKDLLEIKHAHETDEFAKKIGNINLNQFTFDLIISHPVKKTITGNYDECTKAFNSVLATFGVIEYELECVSYGK